MTVEQLTAEIAKLKAENTVLKSGPVRALSMKVSVKGGLSVYGLGRFPITLYKEQWTRLLAVAGTIQTFIKDNDSSLTTKAESKLAKAAELKAA